MKKIGLKTSNRRLHKTGEEETLIEYEIIFFVNQLILG